MSTAPYLETLLFTGGVLVHDTKAARAGGIRLCVTGGRDFTDEGVVWDALFEFHGTQVINELGVGCARGLDALALEWAEENGVSYRKYIADWDRYGLQAGLYRNEAMLEDFKPDLLLVFPGGTGTTDCARRARKLNIERKFIEVGDDPFLTASLWG